MPDLGSVHCRMAMGRGKLRPFSDKWTSTHFASAYLARVFISFAELVPL